MTERVHKSNSKSNQAKDLNITDKQIEIFARRLLPEIKRFFADEDIRKEFEEWRRKQQSGNLNN